MSASRTSFYLDKRNAKVSGVCAGVADYFDIDVLWVRLGFVMTMFFLFPPIFFAYWIVAWTASPKPYSLYEETPDEREFWKKVRVAPQRTIRDTRSSFRETERRLRDIEAYVTSSNSRLANEIDQLR
nr:envelope stress response membrane protein PspC [Polymorphobacter sp.]